MINELIGVKVLEGFHGFPGATVVERIYRKPVRHGCRDRYGMILNSFCTVSYKGKQHKVFNLPACYGDSAGSCITIEE